MIFRIFHESFSFLLVAFDATKKSRQHWRLKYGSDPIKYLQKPFKNFLMTNFSYVSISLEWILNFAAVLSTLHQDFKPFSLTLCHKRHLGCVWSRYRSRGYRRTLCTTLSFSCVHRCNAAKLSLLSHRRTGREYLKHLFPANAYGKYCQPWWIQCFLSSLSLKSTQRRNANCSPDALSCFLVKNRRSRCKEVVRQHDWKDLFWFPYMGCWMLIMEMHDLIRWPLEGVNQCQKNPRDSRLAGIIETAKPLKGSKKKRRSLH